MPMALVGVINVFTVLVLGAGIVNYRATVGDGFSWLVFVDVCLMILNAAAAVIAFDRARGAR